MAVTVTDTRTVLTQADSTASFTGAATVTTSEYAESTGSVAAALTITTGQLYFSPASTINISNTLLYVKSSNTALQLGWQTGAHSLYIGDASNDNIAFHMAGNDKDQFKHADTEVQFQTFVVDGSYLATVDALGANYRTYVSGSFSGLDLSAINKVGGHYITQSKAIGGGYNVFIDIIRYGNDGLVITGGTTGARGTFLEIVIEDRSRSDQKAHGIIRELTTGVYGCQGPLTFGNAVTGTSYFEDDGIVLAYENRYISNDKYYLKVVGPSISGAAYFILTNSTITSAGPYVTCNFSGAGITELTITGCTFTKLGNSISFANDAAASGHTVTGCTFNECGQIDPGDVIFQNNTIQATTASTTGAVLLDADGTANWSNLDFISGGSGHGIYITVADTYNFTNITFSGYSTASPGSNPTPNSGSTDAMVYNFSGDEVTINVTGGTNPTIRNGPDATTIVIATNALDIHVQDTATNPIQSAQVAVYDSNDTQIVNELTNSGGDINTASVEGGASLYIRVRKSTSGIRYYPVETVATISGDLSLTITLREDTIAEL
jgi:hypothetical protein